jgi:hypothetical protein
MLRPALLGAENESSVGRLVVKNAAKLQKTQELKGA